MPDDAEIRYTHYHITIIVIPLYHIKDIVSAIVVWRGDSEELFSDVGTALIPRLRDSNLSVRVQAIDALTRLQDHTDKDNEVTKEYLRISNTDPSKYS